MSRPRSSRKVSGPPASSIQAALCDATVLRAARPEESRQRGAECVSRPRTTPGSCSSSRPTSWPAWRKAIGRADLLTDPRFTDPAKLTAEHGAADRDSGRRLRLAADGALVRGLQGVHVTFGVVRNRSEVVKDPQLRENDIVVPLEGAGGKLNFDDQQPHSGAWRRRKCLPSAPRKSANTTRRFSNSSGSVLPKSRASTRAAPSRRVRHLRSQQPREVDDE